VGSDSRFSLDFAKESNNDILVTTCQEFLTQSCQVEQETFTAPERDRVAHNYICVKNQPSILLSEGDCFLTFQVGGFKDEQEKLDWNRFIWAPVLAHPVPRTFNESVEPKR
jgi:hypothetical protein